MKSKLLKTSGVGVLLILLVGGIGTASGRGNGKNGGLLNDRVEVVIGGVPLTFCEIEAEARIALARRQGGQAADGYITQSLHEAVREFLINQYIVISEANLLQIFNISDAELEKELVKFKENFKSDDEYRKFLAEIGLNEEYLKNGFARNIRVEKFLEYRIKTEVYVTHDEIMDYYSQNRPRFGEQQFDEVREIIRKYLEMQKRASIKKAWLERLRKHQDIAITEIPPENSPSCRVD
ncbi:MAG: hypothetical protein Kow0090_09250 [Myxococcota bacterium]